jgi:hypothetical protein
MRIKFVQLDSAVLLPVFFLGENHSYVKWQEGGMRSEFRRNFQGYFLMTGEQVLRQIKVNTIFNPRC